MKIEIIASDSMGTRSMATYVETKDCKILIDPGVSLAPIRYGLKPHAIEIKRLNRHWKKIKEHARKSNILIVTHYHYDHHNPLEPNLYKGKIVFLKHPKKNINKSQKKRAKFFIDEIEKIVKKLEYSDGGEWKFGTTLLRFSDAVTHGPSEKLGFVTEVMVKEKSTFIHTSDVEGPCNEKQTKFILENKPNTIFIDGPLSYMMYRYGTRAMSASVKNMIRIIENCPLKELIIDHHFLRDLKWKERINKVFKFAEKKQTKILTAAEFNGLKTEMLEALRKELYKKWPKEKAPSTPLKELLE